eukprot:12158088-Prorocentrum_lima.AAC.1
MTSSLVGSEMCIRDRPSGLDELPKGLKEESTMEAINPGSLMKMDEGENCLLYTSDAADDM